MTEHKHAEVLRAIADGKEVQVKLLGKWWESFIGSPFVGNITPDPIANCDLEWRIKPKPPIVVEDCIGLDGDSPYAEILFGVGQPNIRFTFDPDTKLPIKVELI